MDFVSVPTDAQPSHEISDALAVNEKKNNTLAQGIRCGALSLAFTYDWARQVTDEFDITLVPNAPDWLLGMTNIEGNILPVIDLAVYFDVPLMPDHFEKRRLLICSGQNDQNNDAWALIFTGLPQQLSYQPQALTHDVAVPAKLQELCRGIGMDKAGKDYFEIDALSLILSLSNDISPL